MKVLPVIIRDKTMADKLMDIPNDVTPNYPLSILQLVAEMFEMNSIQEKFPKLLS